MPLKPPYRIPLLSEIRKLTHNGLNVVSTFAGCGGSSTGYRMAGYRVLTAVEFVPAAADSYEANMAPHTALLRRDVRGLSAGELLDACGLKVGELDVLDGSPPCEPFSTAGLGAATWGTIREYSGEHQRTDDLFLEYARLVKEMQPRCFVAENVTGLIKGAAKGYFKLIMTALRACGYRVQARVLNASWLGVPQSRERVIIIGTRSDLVRGPVFPEPLSYQYTVRDALPHLRGEIRMEGANGFDRHAFRSVGSRPMPTVQASRTLAVEHSGYDMKPCDVTDQPSPTVMARDAGHWKVRDPAISNRRQFAISELRRICGFPDDYVLTGSFAQQWERLGDSVPPPMAAAWASGLLPMLDGVGKKAIRAPK